MYLPFPFSTSLCNGVPCYTPPQMNVKTYIYVCIHVNSHWTFVYMGSFADAYIDNLANE